MLQGLMASLGVGSMSRYMVEASKRRVRKKK